MNATLELVPEERSLTVDLPPYVMLCFCSVRWRVKHDKPGSRRRSADANRGQGGKGGGGRTCRDLEILALVASLT